MMTRTDDMLERERLTLQQSLDEEKSATDRNKLGQFATPTLLARDIVAYGLSLLPKRESVRFLDPAIGTGAFYSALRAGCPNGRVREAVGFELDPHYGMPATNLWRDARLQLFLADFTRQPADPRFNFIICNPPYVRHHHLTQAEKLRLQHLTRQTSGMKLSGLAGLYCHFLGLAHGWMANDAIAGWLIPSEFMDVNYGSAIKQYLLRKVTLLHIHRFDPNDVQFADALVSSAVVWIRNAPPPTPEGECEGEGHHVRFTFGGTLANPRISRDIPVNDLHDEPKWTRYPKADARSRDAVPLLGDLFKIKRGIATGSNNFFILSEGDARARKIPKRVLRPILPSPRYVPDDIIEADDAGHPMLDKQLFVIDTRLTEAEIKQRHPALWAYLCEGRSQGVHEGYICRHRPLWYAQEQRPPAPIVCTYLGRGSKRNGRPFRFIRNRSIATVANVYLAMYPTPALERALAPKRRLIDDIWRALNEIDIAHMLGEGRVYGGGLHKLEPKELANVPIPALAAELPDSVFSRAREGDLFALARASA